MGNDAKSRKRKRKEKMSKEWKEVRRKGERNGEI